MVPGVVSASVIVCIGAILLQNVGWQLGAKPI